MSSAASASSRSTVKEEAEDEFSHSLDQKMRLHSLEKLTLERAKKFGVAYETAFNQGLTRHYTKYLGILVIPDACAKLRVRNLAELKDTYPTIEDFLRGITTRMTILNPLEFLKLDTHIQLFGMKHKGEALIADDMQEYIFDLRTLRSSKPELFDKAPLAQVASIIKFTQPRAIHSVLTGLQCQTMDEILEVLEGQLHPGVMIALLGHSQSSDKKMFVPGPPKTAADTYEGERKAFNAKLAKQLGTHCGLCGLNGRHPAGDCDDPCREPDCRMMNHGRATGGHTLSQHQMMFNGTAALAAFDGGRPPPE